MNGLSESDSIHPQIRHEMMIQRPRKQMVLYRYAIEVMPDPNGKHKLFITSGLPSDDPLGAKLDASDPYPEPDLDPEQDLDHAPDPVLGLVPVPDSDPVHALSSILEPSR